MNMTFTQMGFLLFLYSLLGWCAETTICTIEKKTIVNAGLLSLPFILTHGIIMTLLASVLPSFGDDLAGQFIMTLIVSAVVSRLARFNVHKLCPGINWQSRPDIFGGRLKGLAFTLVTALIYFLTYQILHPLVLFIMPLIHPLAMKIVVVAFIILTVADIVFVVISVRQGKYTQNLKAAMRLSDLVWRRIQKAYPGIREMTTEEELATFTFAKGMSFDKLIWIFFLSALLGDLIEMVYCRIVAGTWMNRSSVLYGPFSFVWGLGAVVLTIALSPLAKKNDRWVFFGGFFIGGAYEYLCSVFTEIVFGTVFWDYSHMPLNIGGRTNVLFMFFWGTLSLVWIKLIYPAMSAAIERIPPVAGKVITWILVTAMLLNGALTVMAMLRYNVRKIDSVPHSQFDAFIDAQYPDERIEQRWPNMIVV